MNKKISLLCLAVSLCVCVKSQTIPTATMISTNIKGRIMVDSAAVINGTVMVNDTLTANRDVIMKQNLEVTGDIIGESNLKVGRYFSLGDVNGLSNQIMTMAFTPSTSSGPSVLRIFPPSSPIGSTPGSNPNSSPDPSPNLACVTGLNYLTSFANALSVAHISPYSVGTGGNIVLGHMGTKAFIETQGTGTGGVNHPGDLFINSNCNRNVLFFNQPNGFANNTTNVVSVGGKFNLTDNMQIGLPAATNFVDNASRLYVVADAVSASNGIKIRHSVPNPGTFGLKLIEQVDGDKAFAIYKTTNTTTDGTERFSVQGDGRSQISSTNADAFLISDAGNNQVNFKVGNSGTTQILNVAYSLKALSIKSNANNNEFWVNGSGQNHIALNAQIGFGVGSSASSILDNQARLNINLVTGNSGEGAVSVNKGIQFVTNNNDVKLITTSNSLSNPATGSPFTVYGDGRTRIGGEYPTGSTYMLTVNGKIGAREIKVSIQNPWPDYVFEKNYRVKSLEEVEKYINANQHLPNIPSAKELGNGDLTLDIAEMQGKQMEKIEEIYLYLIELNKQVKALKKENEQLKQQLSH